MPLPSPRSDAASAADGHLTPATGNVPVPAQLPVPLSRFNVAPTTAATALLLCCCGSRRWAARIAACRPYPDTEALLAALDEASYDMTPDDLAEALAAESAQQPSPRSAGAHSQAAPGEQRRIRAAHTALQAAQAAYESRFGHAFLICLDGYQPGQRLDQALAGLRTRLGNDTEEERVVTADELRRTARGRLVRFVVSDH